MGPKSKYLLRLSHFSKDLEEIIPSCTGEKLLCANEIEELLGVQTRKFNLTSKFSSATVANVTEPKGKGQKISEANYLVFISSKKRTKILF